MTRQFQVGVQQVREKVAAMAQASRANLLESVKSLSTFDVALADKVIARDAAINRLDVEIERDAMDLIALNSPVAKDLRVLGAALKINTYLDRIGRYGFDIANVTKVLAGHEHVGKPIVIPMMAEKVSKMLDDAIKAFMTEDLELARGVPPQDELPDALYEQIFRESLTYMLEDPRNITAFAHYILVARHLERVGDNACKIAEKTIYMITGQRRIQV